MRRVLLLLLLATGVLHARAPAIEELRLEWTDTARPVGVAPSARKRVVPVHVYLPAQASKPLPAVIFSHGLGGNRDSYEYLGRHWAGKGYVAVHLQHAGSDSEIFKQGLPMQAMRKSIADLENARNRPLDVSFAADRLGDPPLRGRVDTRRLGVAGHSFGAFTALAVAGQTFPGGVRAADPRFRAGVALSAPIPRKRDEASLKASYGTIRIPFMLVTGTQDKTPFDPPGATPEDRLAPFEGMPGPHQILLVLAGADHMTFSGPRRGGRVLAFLERPDVDPEQEARFHEAVQEATTAFWNAWLKDDAAARKWLEQGGLKALGTVRIKG